MDERDVRGAAIVFAANSAISGETINSVLLRAAIAEVPIREYLEHGSLDYAKIGVSEYANAQRP